MLPIFRKIYRILEPPCAPQEGHEKPKNAMGGRYALLLLFLLVTFAKYLVTSILKDYSNRDNILKYKVKHLCKLYAIFWIK